MTNLFQIMDDSCGGLLPVVQFIRRGVFPVIQIGIPILLILVASLILIILFLPLNFLMIRRLHDLNFSGWWIIFPIVFPFGYFIFILYLILAKGTNGPNKYGENPLELTKSSNV